VRVHSGIVKEVLVQDGTEVKAGQVLVRLDALPANKDVDATYAEHLQLSMALSRVQAELTNKPFTFHDVGHARDARPQVYASLLATTTSQHIARNQAYQASLQDAQYAALKADTDLQSAKERLAKLTKTVPLAAEQGVMWERLNKEGFVSRAATADKLLAQFDLAGELEMQRSVVASARTAQTQAVLARSRVNLEYQRTLTQEQTDTEINLTKVTAELAKREHRAEQTELRAPVDGTISGLSIKTSGQVVQGGAPLLSLVPKDEPLMFEGWLKNEDAAYITPGMHIKVKLATYPFQKYGWIEGEVTWVGADAETPETMRNTAGEPLFYRLRGALRTQALERSGKLFAGKPGMQAVADIQIGNRSPLEYLTSPLKKVLLESAREK
jgi:hemolysin D